MFKSIFFRLIFTPCCKYTYNKNNVKFSKPTSSELRQELLKLNSLKVVHKSRSLSNPFPANHCSVFPIATPFPALSILTILLDKHQIKTFENINILIKVKLFVGKSFFSKKLLFEKRLSFGRKKMFLGRKTFFYRKKGFLEKNFFSKKLTFFWKKTCFFEKIFFYLWRLKVSAHKSPGLKVLAHNRRRINVPRLNVRA